MLYLILLNIYFLQMCVDLCYRALAEQQNNNSTLVRAKCFHTLDAYVRLITLLVKHSGETANTVTKVSSMVPSNIRDFIQCYFSMARFNTFLNQVLLFTLEILYKKNEHLH